MAFMDIAEGHGVEVLVTDYCWTGTFVDDSYSRSAAKRYVSFAADHRELDNIPAYPERPFNVNTHDVATLAEGKNFLYLLNPGSYANKEQFSAAIQDTDYDVIITDLFFEGVEPFTSEEIATLRSKVGGDTRLLIAYMSIGEAEDYRYYWQQEWESKPPPWLAEENPDWPGNYKVRYWDEQWQSVIFDSDDSYVTRILNAGFDGVYLDIIDAYEYFEGN